jgi:hypothetical protein
MIRDLTVINNNLAKEYCDQIMDFQGLIKDQFRAYRTVAELRENERLQAQEDTKKVMAELVEKVREMAKNDLEVLAQLKIDIRCNALLIYIKR